MRSSYIENNYGSLFTALASIYKPKLIVECGVLDGYSLIALAKGADQKCKIVGYDLFEDYEFKHGTIEKIKQEAEREGVSDKIQLIKEDAIAAANNYQNEEVDIVHVDISNDGEKLAKFLFAWDPKIKKDGLLIFEGGSHDRDNVEWMLKYGKESIYSFKCWSKFMTYYEFVTLNPYPSLTICRKK